MVPDTVHTPAAGGVTENTTGLPEPPPVADNVAEPPAVPGTGAVNEIDWDSFWPLPTVIVCWTWGAAA